MGWKSCVRDRNGILFFGKTLSPRVIVCVKTLGEFFQKKDIEDSPLKRPKKSRLKSHLKRFFYFEAFTFVKRV